MSLLSKTPSESSLTEHMLETKTLSEHKSDERPLSTANTGFQPPRILTSHYSETFHPNHLVGPTKLGIVGKRPSQLIAPNSFHVSWVVNPNVVQWPTPSRAHTQREHDNPEPPNLDDFFSERDTLWEKNGGIDPEQLKKALTQLRNRHPHRYHPCCFYACIPFPGILLLIFGIVVYIFLWIGHLFLMCRECCANCRRDMFNVGTVRSVNHCVVTEYTAANEEFDFIIHRLPSYYYAIAFDSVYHLYEWLTGNVTWENLTDEELQAIMVCTEMSREVELKISSSEITGYADFKLRGVRSTTFFKNHFDDTNAWEIDFATGHQTLEMNVHVSRNKTPRSVAVRDNMEEKWECAKAHFMGHCGYFSTIVTHNWVHFHFLDIASICTKTVVPLNSVLGKLLYTHLRFTPTINRAGMGMKSNNPQGDQSLRNKLRIWKAAPISQQQLLASVAEQSLNHYVDFGSEFEARTRTNVSEWLVHKAFPPKFVRQRLPRFSKKQQRDDMVQQLESVEETSIWNTMTARENPFTGWKTETADSIHLTTGYDPRVIGLLPYCDMLAEYYEVCYHFCYELFSRRLIEMDLMKNWIQAVQSTGMPKLILENPVDVLATLIWTAGIVHGADHVVHSDLEKATFMSTTTPFRKRQTADEILTPPMWSYGQWQHAKSRVFTDWYVKYYKSWFFCPDIITDPKLYGSFADISLTIDEAKTCRFLSQEFRENLLKLNERWNWIVDVNRLSASVSF